MVKLYLPANGANFSKEQAQRYGERITQLEQAYQGVSKEMVLADAEQPDSPLHDYFEWDDQKAAHTHRLWQARFLLRHLIVKVKEVEVRAFHHVKVNVETVEQEARFISIERVMNHEEYMAEVMEKARQQLVIWERTYSVYRELDQSVKLIRQALQQI